MLAGCALLHQDQNNAYQTVQTDFRYDTETAIEEHEKALKIIEKHFSDQPTYLHHFPPDLSKAEEHLQKALEADVSYGPAHNTLGLVYYWQRKYYLAAWEFEYAAKVMPEKAQPIFNLGLVYENSDQPERALEYYSLALSMDEHNPEMLMAIIRLELKNGKTVDQMRPMMKEYLFYAEHPEYIAWVQDQLGLHPEEGVACINYDDFKPTSIPEAPPAAEPEPSVEEPTESKPLPLPSGPSLDLKPETTTPPAPFPIPPPVPVE